jgi:hypothetical protein
MLDRARRPRTTAARPSGVITFTASTAQVKRGAGFVSGLKEAAAATK